MNLDRVPKPVRNLGRLLARACLHVGAIQRSVRRWSLNGRIPARIWRQFPIPRETFVVNLPGSQAFRYKASSGDAIGHTLFWSGTRGWEAATIATFLKLADRTRLFLDIGAHTGAYSLFACAVNPAARVIAYEPVERVYEKLRENIETNHFENRCDARQVAVHRHVGKTQMHVPRSDLPTSASLDPKGFRGLTGQLVDVDVDVVTADDETRSCGRVELVKIDVEGFEPGVLEGMSRILSTDRPVVLCECNPDGPYRDVQSIMVRHQYVFFHLRGSGPTQMNEVTPDQSQQDRNFAFVPAEESQTIAMLQRMQCE